MIEKKNYNIQQDTPCDNDPRLNKEISLIQQACSNYNHKHNISISFNNNNEPNIGTNEGIIYRYVYKEKGRWCRHYAGCYRIDVCDNENIKRPYYIFFDTFPGSTVAKTNTIKNYLKRVHGGDCKFINIGSGLQADDKSCMVFALKGIVILAKDKGKIAEKIIKYLIKNNCFHKDDILFDITKKDNQLQGDYNLDILPNAGEFIKLAQSREIQKEHSELKCHEEDFIASCKGNTVKLTKKRKRTTVGEYFDNHCYYNKRLHKQQSNKINNLYEKIMSNKNKNEIQNS